MGNQSASRLEGDRYQHLYSWFEMLRLLPEDSPFSHAVVEHPEAGAADDVTLHPHPGSSQAAQYTQIKWHVDHSNQYDFDALMEIPRGGKTSILQKLHGSYRDLSDVGKMELCLLSNRTAHPNFGEFIDARTENLGAEFFTSSTKRAKAARAAWSKTLNIDQKELEAFCSTLRFRLGFDSIRELEIRVDERMAWHGLRAGDDSRHLVTDVVSKWIELGGRRKEVRRVDLLEAIDRHALRAPVSNEPRVRLHVHGWTRTAYSQAATIELDWTAHFDRPSRRVGDPHAWRDRLLPQLAEAATTLRLQPEGHFVDVRGKLPLTASLAVGFSFPEAAGFRLRTEQLSGGVAQHWSTMAKTSDARFEISLEKGGPGHRMLVGVEVSALISDDVNDFSSQDKPGFDSIICIRPNTGYGETAVRSESDAVALALSLKNMLRELRSRLRAKEIHLVLCCPASLALFIGHRLNALGNVYAYERTADGSYCLALHLLTG